MQETKNKIYLTAKKDGILSKNQLEFFNELCLHAPCTVNELIKKIDFTNLGIKPETVDRYPSQLKKIKLVKVIDRRTCKVSSSRRRVDVLRPVDEYPDTKKIVKVTKKAKLMIESSQNAALLAIETFNNPNSRFKTENFVMLINNAWLKIFIAYLYMNNQDIYERDKTGNYVFINGTKEKKTIGFKECLSLCKTVLSLAEYENIKELNQIRDRIEHFFIDEPNLDLQLFGRFQSNIMNYERFLANNFGDNYCINRSLAFSLQFSQFNERQINSMKTLLSQEARDLKKFLKEYEASLSANILGSQEFCLKVLMIPKVSNTNNADFAVEFIREDQIESNTIETINALIKDKRVIIEAKNSGTLKPKQVIDLINKQISENFNQHHFVAICKIFKIRPYGKDIKNPYDTYAKFCTYDEPHKDYVYTTDFVDFVIKLFIEKKWTLENVNQYNQEVKNFKPEEI